MIEPLQRITLFALYQLALVLGILLMPLAVLANRGGVNVPIHRLFEPLRHAYEASKTP